VMLMMFVLVQTAHAAARDSKTPDVTGPQTRELSQASAPLDAITREDGGELDPNSFHVGLEVAAASYADLVTPGDQRLGNRKEGQEIPQTSQGDDQQAHALELLLPWWMDTPYRSSCKSCSATAGMTARLSIFLIPWTGNVTPNSSWNKLIAHSVLEN
jgi:hypothetical protein